MKKKRERPPAFIRLLFHSFLTNNYLRSKYLLKDPWWANIIQRNLTNIIEVHLNKPPKGEICSKKMLKMLTYSKTIEVVAFHILLSLHCLLHTSTFREWNAKGWKCWLRLGLENYDNTLKLAAFKMKIIGFVKIYIQYLHG